METLIPSAIVQNASDVDTLPSLNVYLLGRRITCMTIPAMIQAIDAACKNDTRLTIGSYNVHSFNLSMIHPWFYELFQSIEIAMCDSVGILKAIEFMGVKLPLEYRVTYTMLMPEVLKHCNANDFSVFLLGAAEDHLSEAMGNLSKKYPSMRVSGQHGFFAMNDPKQNDAVIEKINAAKPNVLIVGMGNPRQEEWVRLYGHRLNANVIMLGGAVIKRIAGVASDCPEALSNAGLEWFYRLVQEPSRLGVRYLVGNPAFALQVILAKSFSSELHIEPLSLGSSK
jgi:N-acetylglucosaminyldiphosphoundecaprenol N-acetyl-beta-D-mannosaminyltransferase